VIDGTIQNRSPAGQLPSVPEGSASEIDGQIAVWRLLIIHGYLTSMNWAAAE